MELPPTRSSATLKVSPPIRGSSRSGFPLGPVLYLHAGDMAEVTLVVGDEPIADRQRRRGDDNVEIVYPVPSSLEIRIWAALFASPGLPLPPLAPRGRTVGAACGAVASSGNADYRIVWDIVGNEGAQRLMIRIEYYVC